MALIHSPRIITDGLVFCLDAANPDSYPGAGTVWNDLVSSNNGTLTNGPVFNSANGGSIVFDGLNDYVTLPNTALPVGTQITFCIWNFGVEIVPSTVVWFNDVNTIRVFQIHLPWNDGIVYFDAGNGIGGSTGSGYDRISKNIGNGILGWNYWCFTKNTTTQTMRIYLNGQLWHIGTGLTQPIGAASGPGLIGCAINAILFHKGRVSNCSFYNRELSPAEILQNYNATKGRFNL